MAQHILLIMQVLYIFHLISHALRVLKRKSILFKVSIKMSQKFAEQGKHCVWCGNLWTLQNDSLKGLLSFKWEAFQSPLSCCHKNMLIKLSALFLASLPCSMSGLLLFVFVVFCIPLSSWGFSIWGRGKLHLFYVFFELARTVMESLIWSLPINNKSTRLRNIIL